MIVNSESSTYVPSSDSTLVTYKLDMTQTKQSSQMDPSQVSKTKQIVNDPHFTGSRSILDTHIIKTTPRMNMNFAPQQMLCFTKTMPQSPLSPHVNTQPHPKCSKVEKRVKIEVGQLKKELTSVRSSLVALQNKVKAVSKQNDELEQYSRLSCLRVSVSAQIDNENVEEVVLVWCRHNTTGHRYGPWKQQT